MKPPPTAHPELDAFDDLCLEVLATQGPDVLKDRDALRAEEWASRLLGLFASLPLAGDDDPAEAIGGRLVMVARAAQSAEAMVCLKALSAVSTGRLRQRAIQAARALEGAGVDAPAWAEAIGAAVATEAWRATDCCGDQDSVMIGFVQPSGSEHSVVALLDHLLGGIAKDAGLAGPVDELLPTWLSDPDIALVAEPVPVAAARVMRAMERTEGVAASGDYRDTVALLQARLSRLATTVPDEPPVAADQRAELVQSFLNDPAGVAYLDDADARHLLVDLVDYRCDEQRGDPRRWSPAAAERFLLDRVPQLALGGRTVDRAPDLLWEWVRWAAPRADLPPTVASRTLTRIGQLESAFATAVRQALAVGDLTSLTSQGVDR
jgi:hypothetical protein